MSFRTRLLTLAPLVVLVGCAPELPPSTLEISDVQPRELDVGDRLEILGTAFPVKRTAHVVLRGQVYRPGLEPRGLSVALDVESKSEGRLEVPVTEALATRIAGPDTAHATFRGDVLVSFPAAEATAAPLVGKAAHVVLDVRPEPPRAAVLGQLDEQGRKAAEFFGLEIGKGLPSSGGLVVTSVRPGSPAARAGILPKDLVVEVDGVRVASLADLLPAPETTSTLVVRREGEDRERSFVLSLEGWSQRLPRALVASAIVASSAAAAVALASMPPTFSGAWLEARIAAMRARRRRRATSPAGSLARPFSGSLARPLGSILASSGSAVRMGGAIVARVQHVVEGGELETRDPGAWIEALAAALAGACLVVGRPWFGVDADVATLATGAIGTTIAASLVAGRGGANEVVRHAIPGALGGVTIVLASGGLRVEDVLRAQGAAPWDWLVVRTPFVLLSATAWLGSAALLGARDRIASLSGTTPGAPPLTWERRCFDTVTAVLFAGLLLGGPSLPGQSLDPRGAQLALALAVMLAKIFAVRAAIAMIREAAFGAVDAARASWRGLLPAALVATAAQAAWTVWSPSPSVVRATALATFAATAAVVSWVVLRTVSAIRRVGHEWLDPRV